MDAFILFFGLCAVVIFVYNWLQNIPPVHNNDRVIYIGDCEGVPGYAEQKRAKAGGCFTTIVIIIFLLGVLFFLL